MFPKRLMNIQNVFLFQCMGETKLLKLRVRTSHFALLPFADCDKWILTMYTSPKESPVVTVLWFRLKPKLNMLKISKLTLLLKKKNDYKATNKKKNLFYGRRDSKKRSVGRHNFFFFFFFTFCCQNYLKKS